ncbi:MAG: hypothetical protein KIT52_06670 [Anaerolineae bacterium]|nr:hypothetical protein [Anaerolineae bacterium]
MFTTRFTANDFRAPVVRRRLAALALLLLIALAACGGDDTPAAEPTLAPASQATTAPQADAPTEAPPAAATPTATPTATALPAAATAAPVAAGECDNPFFPAVEGRVMTYRNTVPAFGESEFSHTFSDVTDSSFNVNIDVGDGESVVQKWTCSADGLLSPEMAQMPGMAEGMTFEYVEASGATLPAADQMTAGHEWTTHYVVEVTMPDLGQGAMSMSETVDLINTVAGEESVTVPAGTFDAVRVDTAGAIAVSIAGAPASNIEMSMVSWYAEGVGLVRQEIGGMLGGDDTILTELVSVE